MALTREQRPRASEEEQVQDWAPMPFPSDSCTCRRHNVYNRNPEVDRLVVLLFVVVLVAVVDYVCEPK